MSEFRVVEANGDPYPPHAQPCRTLRAAMLRRDFYEQLTVVSGENLRLPVGPLRIERRSMVVSAWAAADLLASSTAEKLAPPRKHSASASDPMPLCDCEFCARPLRDHEEETR